jgi:hypothetical protein
LRRFVEYAHIGGRMLEAATSLILQRGINYIEDLVPGMPG